MEVETPARIAVLGAGPIGLEAAIYARYLGYDVDVYECGQVASSIRRWGHVRMFSPFALNRSPLGLAALYAQDPDWRPPADTDLLTGGEYAERYLLPLSQSDLLADSVHEHVRVLAVGRAGPLKGDLPGDAARRDHSFRLLLHDRTGERIAKADVVIDATGVYRQHQWLGRGGIPAAGERQAARSIEYGLPDILGGDRQRYAGRRVLVAGSGYSAATSVVALAELASVAPGTHVIWVTRPRAGQVDDSHGPIPVVPHDRLPERDRLARAANALAAGASPHVEHWPDSSITRLRKKPEGDEFVLRLAGRHKGKLRVERIVANVGYRPDLRLFRELQVHLCYASEGPMKLAAALLGSGSADCLDQRSQGPATLVNPEPDFYILGAKSYGRNSQFLITLGLAQVRELFSLVGGRADLDLYATAGGGR